MSYKKKIIFSWNEIPPYGAGLINQAINDPKLDVEVISTLQSIPVKGVEQILGKQVHWVDPEKPIRLLDLGLDDPDIFFQAGWYVKPFISIGSDLTKKGIPIVLLSDNCKKTNLNQTIASFILKSINLLRNLTISEKSVMVLTKSITALRFNAAWVPGKSGIEFMKSIGFKRKNIYDHLYGTNTSLFLSNKPLLKRSKEFIFIGRLDDSKGIVQLIKGFLNFMKYNPSSEWKLGIYGEGKLKPFVEKSTEKCKNINFYGFAQKEAIAPALGNARCLILPSFSDHWPLVISEAALSGCGLIVSKVVGNIPEFCTKKNSFILQKVTPDEICSAMIAFSKLSDQEVIDCQHESMQLGKKFDLLGWKSSLDNILEDFKIDPNRGD